MKIKNENIDWNSIETLLESWFNLGLSKYDSLPFYSSDVSRNNATIAGSIFKRGAKDLHDLSNDEFISLKNVNINSSSNKKSTRIGFYADLMSFFNSGNHKFKNSVFFCDKAVAQLHPTIELELSKRNIQCIQIECTETNKNLKTIVSILNKIPDHAEQIFAIGGGICCDLVGFIGSLSETKIHYLPTTLLACVDAGLGGKTGVNHQSAGKNQIGLFAHVDSITVITDFLNTLTPSLVRQGLSEIIKHSFLSGNFDRWQSQLHLLLQAENCINFTRNDLNILIKENLDFKKNIVAIDPYESNIRALLNFGHTIAHLIEGLFASSQIYFPQREMSHGVAVAIGLLMISKSNLATQSPPGFNEILEELLVREGFTLPLGQLSTFLSSARKILLQDKKNNSQLGECVTCITPSYGCLAKLVTDFDQTQTVLSNTSIIQVDELLKILKKTGLFE